MDANTSTDNSDMKISYPKSQEAHNAKTLFVAISKFDTDNFPVRVRRLGLARIFHQKFGERRATLRRV